MTSSTIELASDIISNFVAHNSISPTELPALIRSVYSALSGVDEPDPAAEEAPVRHATPMQVRRSISDDGLVSFIDGKKYKTLKRHLTTNGMTIADYKARFGLPQDYPTTAPAYSAARSALAKSLGLGQRGAAAKSKAASTRGRGRPRKDATVASA